MTPPTRHPLIVLVALALGGLIVSGGGFGPRQQGLSPTPARELAPLPGEPVNLGAADPADQLEVSFVLRGRDPAGLATYLVSLGDPASPDYQQYLTAAEFGDRFGAAGADEARVMARLTAAGMTVVRAYPQRSRVTARGSAAVVSALLDVAVVSLQDAGSGARYFAADGLPSVPADLADVVSGVTGLERRLATPAADLAAARKPAARGLTPADLAAAYDYQTLWDAGIDGAGQAVAIIQFGVDTDKDLAVFDKTFGIKGPKPERIKVGDGLKDAPADFASEATLDTQVVRAVAPGADILVYGFPATTSFGAAVDTVVQDGRSRFLSISYGKCFAGGYLGQAEYEDTVTALAGAAAAGVTLFAASGDWGAFTCHVFDLTDSQISSFFPACTNNVVGVGGTFLDVRRNGSYLRETGWEDYLITGGTGGGLSLLDPRPAYQAGVPGLDDGRANPEGLRQCPDVAAVADPDSGYLIFQTDPASGDAGWLMVGGTSAATPFWAGAMALVGQKAAEAGISTLPFLAPLFYQIAASTPDAFHDVTRGGNLVDDATAGWDYATGLGSPDVAVLADAIIASQQ